jgi:hypothetical protein
MARVHRLCRMNEIIPATSWRDGIFFEIWPFEHRHDLHTSSFGILHPSEVNKSRALWIRLLLYNNVAVVSVDTLTTAAENWLLLLSPVVDPD